MDASKAFVFLPKLLIRIFQFLSASPVRTCRFYPTCSHYAIDALEHKGLISGLTLTLVRILKCHPWHPGGYDPIPL